MWILGLKGLKVSSKDYLFLCALLLKNLPAEYFI